MRVHKVIVRLHGSPHFWTYYNGKAQYRFESKHCRMQSTKRPDFTSYALISDRLLAFEHLGGTLSHTQDKLQLWLMGVRVCGWSVKSVFTLPCPDVSACWCQKRCNACISLCTSCYEQTLSCISHAQHDATNDAHLPQLGACMSGEPRVLR